jgi:hypothetical protein
MWTAEARVNVLVIYGHTNVSKRETLLHKIREFSKTPSSFFAVFNYNQLLLAERNYIPKRHYKSTNKL